MTEIRPLTPAYPALARSYDAEFRVDPAYKDSLPDLQNGPASLIVGARTAIQHVGISNFRLPIRYLVRDGGEITLETSVTGTVSLEADRKGINMSRIMRSFYGHADHAFSLSVLEAALDDYKTDLDALDARIQMRFSYPVRVDSLRSGLSGWQYYDIALEVIDVAGGRVCGSCMSITSIRRPALFAGTVRACPTDARAAGHPAFAAVGRADIAGDGRPRADLVRGYHRTVPRRGADRDTGHGQARG